MEKYKSTYRIAYDFHTRHIPSSSNPAYWETVCADAIQTSRQANNDPFIMNLLCAIIEELRLSAK